MSNTIKIVPFLLVVACKLPTPTGQKVNFLAMVLDPSSSTATDSTDRCNEVAARLRSALTDDVTMLDTLTAFEAVWFVVCDKSDAAGLKVLLRLNRKTVYEALRQGELLALRWEDVDLVVGRILVRRAVARGKIGTPKSGKSREVEIGERAVAALKQHRHLKGELVFSDADGKLLSKGACKWPLWRACKKAGLRRIGWHVLRHTFASHLVMLGAPLKAVQELLGHATIEMTMRYAHLSPDARHAAARLLDRRGTLTAHDGKQQLTH